MLSSSAFSLFWRKTRLWKVGTPLIAAVAAAPSSYLLLLMGGGQITTDSATGVIVWSPVAACAMLGATVGVVVALAVGLIRTGGRKRVRRQV